MPESKPALAPEHGDDMPSVQQFNSQLQPEAQPENNKDKSCSDSIIPTSEKLPDLSESLDLSVNSALLINDQNNPAETLLRALQHYIFDEKTNWNTTYSRLVGRFYTQDGTKLSTKKIPYHVSQQLDSIEQYVQFKKTTSNSQTIREAAEVTIREIFIDIPKKAAGAWKMTRDPSTQAYYALFLTQTKASLLTMLGLKNNQEVCDFLLKIIDIDNIERGINDRELPENMVTEPLNATKSNNTSKQDPVPLVPPTKHYIPVLENKANDKADQQAAEDLLRGLQRYIFDEKTHWKTAMNSNQAVLTTKDKQRIVKTIPRHVGQQLDTIETYLRGEKKTPEEAIIAVKKAFINVPQKANSGSYLSFFYQKLVRHSDTQSYYSLFSNENHSKLISSLGLENNKEAQTLLLKLIGDDKPTVNNKPSLI